MWGHKNVTNYRQSKWKIIMTQAPEDVVEQKGHSILRLNYGYVPERQINIYLSIIILSFCHLQENQLL